MLCADRSKLSTSQMYFVWFLMAFQAGYVNSGGFISAQSFVSHVTGFGTHIGMSIADQNWIFALEFLSIPICFILGAAFSSYFIECRKLNNKRPMLEMVLFIKFMTFVLVFVGGINGWYGVFEDKIITDSDFLLIPLLCFACGIQNSTCSQLTGGFLKPTHLTGLSTDIGIHISKVLTLKKLKSRNYQEEKTKNLTRMGVFFSFSSGAAISFLTFHKVGYAGFLFPMVTSGAFFIVTTLESINSEKFERFNHNLIGKLIPLMFGVTLLNAFM